MLNAPTSVTKTATTQSKPQHAPMPERELYPHAPVTAGAYSLNGMGSAPTVRSPEAQRRQALSGMQSTHGNQAVLRMLHNPQQATPMLALRPSQGVMLQRKCACGGTPGPEGECAECKAKREAALQRCAANQEAAPAATDSVPPIVHDVLRSSGQPLDASTRAFMEPRFGHDFSHVRVHTDAKATESAQAVNALAYTVGRNVVFGSGQYKPGTNEGKRLMAHELTHVVQQKLAGNRTQPKLAINNPNDAAEVEADHAATTVTSGTGKISASFATSLPSIQRACGPTAIGSPVGCTSPKDPGIFPSGFPIFKFDKGCNEFASGQDTALLAFVHALPPTATMEIHGFASTDGLASFNESLACARALAAQLLLTPPPPTGGGIAPSRITGVFNHGPTPGTAAERRSVVIRTTVPEPQRKPKCGPDATDWLVEQVNMAMKDRDVLETKIELAMANFLASQFGITANTLAEAAGFEAITAQEALLGSRAPARNPVINAQLAAGAASLGAATSATSRSLPVLLVLMASLSGAALKWRSLVNHGARYDFKAHSDSMNHPKGTSCPDPDCPPGEVGIITLCPGSVLENCYESDLPGNLFYSLIGRFIGWSELTLQLGSQYAELTDVTIRPFHPAITWDSPEDTAIISLAYRALPLPLTRAALCDVVPGAHGTLSKRDGCDECLEQIPPKSH